MGILDQLNRFVKNPTTLDISRSRFGMPFTHKLTMNSGELVPILCKEVLPGDTFDITVSNVTRMITPAVPVMDNCFMDCYFFFVPNRISCFDSKDWAKICGENFNGAWSPDTESTLQSTGNTWNRDYTSDGIKPGSAINHLGFPILKLNEGTSTLNYSTLPINGYVKIWNEWFRDQNVQSPLEYYDSTTLLANEDLTNSCLPVNKIHDYFTACLPSPQKGAPVLLPIGGMAPVVAGGSEHILSGDEVTALKFRDFSTTGYSSDGVAYGKAGEISSNAGLRSVAIDTVTSGATGNLAYLPGTVSQSGWYHMTPSNLYADLANATAASVNQIRQAFAIQRLLEKDARGGSRYREMLKNHFGVTIPDLTVQIPEYLGGKRVPINVTQVLQTSSTDTVSGSNVLGGTGAFSNTSWQDRPFIKSFNEFGYIIGVACIRTTQTYSQGLEKHWSRNRRYDWYYPAFANLGEQPVYKKELHLKGMNGSNYDSVFGYQEAWAEYRYSPSLVTGYLAPDSGDTLLTKWTYTNSFVSTPVLNSEFMKQPKSQIANTLAYGNNLNYQFISDFYFDIKATRPMPVFSIPGLIDHH